MVSEIYGTPVEVELAGKTYKMTRLDIEDLGLLEDYIRSQRVNLINRLHKQKQMSDFEYRWQLAHVFDPRENFTLMDHLALSGSPRGMRFTIWLSLRKHQPEIELEQIDQLVPMEEAMEVIRAMNRFDRIYEEEKEQSPEKDSRESSEKGTAGKSPTGGSSSGS